MSEDSPSNVKRGFGDLPCLYCGESGCITLELADVTGEEAFRCRECEHEWSAADAQAKLAAWAPVLAWINQAPLLSK